MIEMLADVNLGKDLEILGQDGTVVVRRSIPSVCRILTSSLKNVHVEKYAQVVGVRGKVEINPICMISRESAVTAVALPRSTKVSCSIYRTTTVCMTA